MATAKKIIKTDFDNVDAQTGEIIAANQPNTESGGAATLPAPRTSIELGTLQATSPRMLVDGATAIALELANVIRRQHLWVHIQGREFVKVEGWTTLGVMLGVVPREVSTVHEDGIYTATVELVRIADGAVVSRASAECGSPDEVDRYGKPIWADRPRYARRSMAQTRATGKACRLAFSWIMALAGYEPTPAEEMMQEEQANHSRANQPKPEAKPIGNQSTHHKHLESQMRALGLDRNRVKAWCKKQWGVEHLADLTYSQCQTLKGKLPDFATRMAEEKVHKTAQAEAKAEREAIQREATQAEAPQDAGPSPEKQRKAEELLEQARQLRQSAQYADGQAYYQETDRAQRLEAQAQALLR
jgi:hypothetical protein